MKHGGARYRIAVSGDTVIAKDTITSKVQAFRKRKIEDGEHRLDLFGRIGTKGGQIVSVSRPAESTGYVLRSERDTIVVSRKTDPRWRLTIGHGSTVAANRQQADHAVLRFGGNRLGFLDGNGLFRLDPLPSAAAGPSKSTNHSGNPTKFDLGGDFSP